MSEITGRLQSGEVYKIPSWCSLLFYLYIWTWHGSCGSSPAFHRGGPGLLRGQCTWNLRWTKWQSDRFSYFVLSWHRMHFIVVPKFRNYGFLGTWFHILYSSPRCSVWAEDVFYLILATWNYNSQNKWRFPIPSSRFRNIPSVKARNSL
jgi:hypothetical protein